jgi:hypothetical protein
MLNMRIVRAPLTQEEYGTILSEYNRLTLAQIPMSEFLRWVLESPEGPAWHALLETDDRRIVGHTSVLPLRAQYRAAHLVAAMSEYSFTHEDFRRLKIRGFENSGKPAFIVLLDQLFQHCLKEGWGPLFASTNERNQIFTRKVGLRPAEFPLMECLLVLKPSLAARRTPNLSTKQRTVLYAAGVLQRSVWSIARHLPGSTNGVHEVPVGFRTLWPEQDRLSFYEESESVQWRYLADQYVHYAIDPATHDYLIAKRGREDRYLRVCQYRLSSASSVNSVVRTLIKQAWKDGAMGVRWAVYDDGTISDEIVNRLRRLGFLCARRIRIVMVHKNFPEYLQPAAWRMSDSHFCFDP